MNLPAGTPRPDVERLRRLARVWDDLLPMPFVRRRIGLDAIIGLVPGIGDVLGAVVASWALVVGAKLGAPVSVLGRMLLNIAIDALVGAIPLVGDIFDLGWRAQNRNLKLLERWLERPDRTRRMSTAVLVATAAGLVGILVGTMWLAVRALTFLIPGL